MVDCKAIFLLPEWDVELLWPTSEHDAERLQSRLMVACSSRLSGPLKSHEGQSQGYPVRLFVAVDSMGRICINWLMLVKCFEDGNGYISAWYYYYADNGCVEESWR